MGMSSEHTPKRLHTLSQRYLQMQVHCCIFTKARMWKLLNCLSPHEQIMEAWHRGTVEFYSDTKNNEIMQFSGK